MASLALAHVRKLYGEAIAVADVTLDVADGEFVVLLGPSGCGKTTTLRMIAGFVEPSAGSIAVGARPITGLPPWRRNCGLVFQNYALFPHLSVADNVAFSLDLRKVSADERQRRVAEALKLVRLDGLGERFPRQLSGGQQQRVALARAIAMQPDILLLDEPMSNLDAKLRQEVRVEIRSLQRELGLTTIMVTHDQEEALTMADRLVVMEHGTVRQIGTREELYEHPADRFVAGFIGRSSFIAGKVDGPERFVTTGGLVLPCPGGVAGSGVLALRPERIRLFEAARALNYCLEGKVTFVSYLGATSDLHVALADGQRLIAAMGHGTGLAPPAIGDSISLGWPAEAAIFYPDDPKI